MRENGCYETLSKLSGAVIIFESSRFGCFDLCRHGDAVLLLYAVHVLLCVTLI